MAATAVETHEVRKSPVVHNKPPKTLTPWKVWVGNLLILAGVWTIFFVFLSLFFEAETTRDWGSILAVITLGTFVYQGVMAIDVGDWDGVSVFDPLFETRRVIFGGLHQKFPWEQIGEPISLLRSISSEETEEFGTNDPAENMVAKILISARLVTIVHRDGTLVTPEEAARNFIKFTSIDPTTLRTTVRGEIVGMFDDYYGGNEMEDLLKAGVVERKVLEEPSNQQKIKDLEGKYGADMVVVLKSSGPDKNTRDLKRSPAKAEAVKAATEKLKSTGISPERAHLTALLLDGDARVSEHHFGVTAPDLKGLQNATVIFGTPFGTQQTGGHEK